MKIERPGEMAKERGDGSHEKASPTVAAKHAAEAAARALRKARSSRMAAALSSANQKTGLFKK